MKRALGIVALLMIFNACNIKKAVQLGDDGIIAFTFIQLNDVQEIAPLDGEAYGGLARVASVYDSIKASQPNTYLFMAGNFLSPSSLRTHQTKDSLVGKEMVEVMNAMNFELVTFGNHEFDLTASTLQKRLNESNFYWTSANCYQQLVDGPRSFYFERGGDTIYIPETYSINIKDTDGTSVEVGLFGVTLLSNNIDYVYYSDVLLEAGSAYTSLQQQAVDVIMALTHLETNEDIALAEKFPDLSFIMGGHTSYARYFKAGNATISKSDPNAKAIYIHHFKWNTKTQSLSVTSNLQQIHDKIPEKPSVKRILNQ